MAFQDAVRKIAQEISSAGLHGLFGSGESQITSSGRDEPKKLDLVAVRDQNIMFGDSQSALHAIGFKRLISVCHSCTAFGLYGSALNGAE